MRCGKRCGPGGVRALGGGDAIACTGRDRLKAGGARARAERTRNIWCMVTTLEVSKLSGWLNATAYCRESKGGHAVRDGVRAGWREVEGDRGARSVQGERA